MSTNAGNSNPCLSQPSSSAPPASESSGSKASKGPKEKKKIIIQADGSVVGEYAKVWSSRTGDFVRSYLPISYKDIRTVPKNFKDDVWNALMGEFELEVPPDVARPLAEKSWPQKFRSHKNNLRPLLNEEVGPAGIDPHIWRKFVENESDPKKKEQNVTNCNNRKQQETPHTLGRCSYAQKQFLMEQENPGKKIRRVDKWLAAHERRDGTVLESAKSKYDEVIVAGNRKKSQSLSDSGCNDMCEDLDNDELAEVFGKELKGGGVRAVGSHVSKKQLSQLGVARSIIEQKGKTSEDKSFKDEVILRLNNFEDVMMSFITKFSNVSTPPMVTTPSSDLASNSVNRPIHLGQNLNNVFAAMENRNSLHSMPTPTDKPPVILLDKFGKELAKGYVVTDASAKTCHFKTVGIDEKKVYIEEVIDPNARLFDPPQGGFDTLGGFVQGGYVIWLENRLKYV